MPGGMWNGRRRPCAPESALHFLPRAQGEVGLGHCVLPPAGMRRPERRRSLILAAWPRPLQGHSPKCPRQRPWAHVVHGDPARDSKLSASPRKIPGARKALAGWQKVGDRAFEPADLIPALADKPFPLLLCAVVG